jgi:serine-type D-Ala-D-Ala carboxypeptidase (penicillin-binding protein 5/6)
MRRAGLLAMVVAVLCATGAAVAAPASDRPPDIAARSYILVEPASGAVLARRAPNAVLPMASTTKMMTALLTLERTSLDQTAVVPREAAAIGGSSAGLVAGERLTIRDLLIGLLVPSGNDAAITLADRIGGTQARFVAMMNRRARSLGLRSTRFVTPHGLDRPGHHSTVRDLVRLAEAAWQHPEFRAIVSRKRATIPGPFGRGRRVLRNENLLLSLDPEADGVKTGHTAGAGYALVAHASRRPAGVGLFAAMIGEPSEAARARDGKRLLDWGLSQFSRVTVLRQGQVLARGAVRDRPGVTVGYAVEGPLVAVVRSGQRMRQTIVAPGELVAPVAAGQPVGEVVVRLGGRVIGRRTLVAERGASAPSIPERIHAGLDRLL